MTFKRSLAKSVVSAAHHAAMTTVSTIAIKAVVQPEEDSTEDSLCELGGFAVGTAIWWKTTDRVQHVVDYAATVREARKFTKQSTEK
jgi:hypothetical protein